MKRISIFILLLILTADSISVAQHLAVKNFSNNDNELDQTDVYTMMLDKRGILWLGTLGGGLSKFDGNKFTTYTESQGLANGYIKDIVQSKDGNIWIATLGGGASCFDGINFKNYSPKDGLCNNELLSVIEDKSGNLWFGSDNGGLSRFADGKFKTFTMKDGLHSNFIRTILQDSHGSIWFSSSTNGGGVTKLENNAFKIITSKNGLVSDNVITIYEDSRKNLWFGTDIGLSIYNGSTFTNISSSNGLPENAILCFCEDRNDNSMWIGTNGSGLVNYKNGKITSYSTKNGLSSDKIYKIIQDRRGDLWLGTSFGIDHIAAERFHIFSKKSGLTDFPVYAFCEGPENEMWIASDGDGVFVNINGSLKHYTNVLPSLSVSSLYRDSRNNIWIGTRNGLVRYSKGSFKIFTSNDGLPDNFVFSIAEDNNDNLWVGTANGLSRYDYSKFYNYSTKNGLIDNKIHKIYKDKTGSMWFGSMRNGVSRLVNGKFINYTKKEGLANNTISHITEDTFGNLWLCTDGGISRFDGNTFKNFTVKDGLTFNATSYIINDDKYYYIGTERGLNKVRIEDVIKNGPLNTILYINKTGLSSTECTSGGITRDSKGNFWFGTKRGATVYNPSNQPVINPPDIFIDRILINDRQISSLNIGELKYYQNKLQFEWNTPDFRLPEKVIYKYKLEGIDTGWNSGLRDFVLYPYLPDGNYTFRVKAVNSDGAETSYDAHVSFTITPPFYKTWYFNTAMIMLLLSAVYYLFRLKTKQVQKRNIELAMMVRERTKELEDEKDKSDELLQNILPVSTVSELKSKGFVKPREIKNMSILFTDFKGFTYIAGMLPADKLVNELNEIFKGFDEIIERNGVEKLKTIGDSYMIGAGLPEEAEDHAIKVIKVAREMLDYITERNINSAIKWEMRAGVHSGSVIAGVVGKKKFSYDIWGDTVNIASRMESAGSPGEINISAYTYMLVRDYFDCEYRGKVTAKGKGELDMYFIKGPKQHQHDLFQQPEINEKG